MIDEQELLKNRAKDLAKKDDSDSYTEEGTKEMLGFLLSGEHYALEDTFVAEVLNIQEMTPIPGTPAYLTGIMNVRGRIIPVLDLKKFFNLVEEGIVNSAKTIIIQGDSYELAILADAILPTLQISESSIKPVPSNLHGIGAEHLQGVTQDAVIIIDGKSLINKIKTSLLN
jgi:purine-binding chemotaxis protein CheW